MTWVAVRNSFMAGLNELLPLMGHCVPGPCPAVPTEAEILWWHLVTAFLLITAVWSVVNDVRGYPENQAFTHDETAARRAPPW